MNYYYSILLALPDVSNVIVTSSSAGSPSSVKIVKMKLSFIPSSTDIVAVLMPTTKAVKRN